MTFCRRLCFQYVLSFHLKNRPSKPFVFKEFSGSYLMSEIVRLVSVFFRGISGGRCSRGVIVIGLLRGRPAVETSRPERQRRNIPRHDSLRPWLLSRRKWRITSSAAGARSCKRPVRAPRQRSDNLVRPMTGPAPSVLAGQATPAERCPVPRPPFVASMKGEDWHVTKERASASNKEIGKGRRDDGHISCSH